MKHIAFGLLLFLLADALRAQPLDPYGFYPAAVGNKWRWLSYPDSTIYDTEITKDSLDQNGSRFLFLNGSTSARYVVDTLGQVLQIINDVPVLWYRLAALPGDTFSVAFLGNTYTVTVTSGTASAFGHPVPAKIFSWSYGQTYPNYAVQWLVYGVGLASTYSLLYNVDESVTGYKINGVSFGTLAEIGWARNILPSGYSLEQNYPNPFNPSTTIRYGLPRKSVVQLTVFNTLGQRVATLVQEEQEAGYHEVKFEASGLSSGVYFYRLTAGNFVQTRKLLLLR